MRTHTLRALPGASALALATMLALAPHPLAAQAFLGTPTVGLGAGSVTIDRSVPGTDTITVDVPQAVVNWAPSDTATGGGDIVFLPNGSTANYAGGAALNGGRYTVLNRILATDPSRRILLDGAINSDPAGAVWFYAPGGLLVGSGARINVGSLLLTANDPDANAVTGEFVFNTGTGFLFSATAAAGSTAEVAIAPGAEINALSEGSYVMAVAPRITQGGAVRVNGTAALVAAESASFTYDAGLFDISVSQGTEAAGGVFSHNGSTTGPAALSPGDIHRIYMVAVPKNDAITMFVEAGGGLGFDIAGAVSVDGSAIVLSAGHNVFSSPFGDPISPEPVNGVSASVALARGDYTSTLFARASDRIEIGDFTPAGASDISFAGDVSIAGRNFARIVANQGQVRIEGNVSVTADNLAAEFDETNRVGGQAFLSAAGAGTLLSIGGNAVVTAVGAGGESSLGAGGSGTGGEANIHSQGGTIAIAGSLTANADGFGGASPVLGGASTGGLAQVQVFDPGGIITIGGPTALSAEGRGGTIVSGPAGIGGEGRGGIVRVSTAPGGSIAFAGEFAGFAGGTGGDGGFDAGTGGAALGGEAIVFAEGDIAFGLAPAPLTLEAIAFGGSGAIGGAATGGRALFNGRGGSIAVDPGLDTIIDASASGGTGFSGAGGAATGGEAIAEIFGGLGGTIGFGAFVTMDAGAFAGSSSSSGTGDGGVATGGTVRVSADSGAISLASLVASADAQGGTGRAGGSATGGRFFVDARDAQISLQSVVASVDSSGGDGGFFTGGAGGAATGGTITVSAMSGTNPGTILSQDWTLLATTSGGTGGDGGADANGGAGGAATGSSVTIFAQAGNGQLTATNLSVFAETVGGSGGASGSGSVAGLAGGDGGAATGGFLQFGLISGPGAATLAGYARADAVALSADAFGGNGGTSLSALAGQGGAGGAATGGRSLVLARGAELTVGSVTLSGNAVGGFGGTGAADGGDGAGGSATGGGAGVLASPHFVTGGPATASLATVFASATASGGGSDRGLAGSATGGEAYLELGQNGGNAPNTGALAVTGDVELDAAAFGGTTTSGTAGAATGGLARVTAAGGAMTLDGLVTVSAIGIGGNAVLTAGGSGVGGTAVLRLDGGSLTLTQAISIDASGFGGQAFDTGSGGLGGGGTAEAVIGPAGGTLTLATLDADATGSGGSGPNGGGDANGGTVRIGSGGGGVFDASGSVTGVGDALAGTAITGPGGIAIGGDVDIGSFGGTARYRATVSATASAFGGDTDDGAAGAAIAGRAAFSTNGGSAEATDLFLGASATGGSALTGSGGAANGGEARLFAAAAGDSITVAGIFFADASGSGGEGGGTASVGGAGTGGFAGAGAGLGTVAFTGTSAQATSIGTGGVGASGGAGQGGEASFGAFGAGTLSLAGFALMDARGIGGSGLDGGGLNGSGGIGGRGQGGIATLSVNGATNANRLTAGDTLQLVDGLGGSGGAGVPGQAGGAGGEGVGGVARSGTGSNSGVVDILILNQSANGLGGGGGLGGDGAAGGAGGVGRGGRVGVGTDATASAEAGQLGWGEVFGSATGIGGSGGNGGAGGAGGAGGDGFGGTAAAGGRGAQMVFNTLARTADGLGGAGGLGTIEGAGGAGSGGEAFVSVVPPPDPALASRLSATAVLLDASGSGGTGGTAGAAVAGFSVVSARGGEIEIGDLTFGASGTAPAGPSASGFTASGIRAFDGVVRIGGDLFGSFAGNVALSTSNGSIEVAGLISLATDAAIVDALTGLAPSAPGVVQAGGDIVLTAAGGIDSSADFASTGQFQASAGGDIRLGAVRGDAGIAIAGPGLVTTGALQSAGFVTVAGTSLTLGSIAAGNLSLSSPTALTLGDLRSEGTLEILSDGAITAGALSAGDSVIVRSTTGGISVGAVDAGQLRPSTDPAASFAITLDAAGAVQAGDLTAGGPITLVARGAGLQAGQVGSDADVVALAGGGVTLAGLRTGPGGRALIASDTMAGLLDAGFILIFNVTPERLPGAVAINGPIAVDGLSVAATGGLDLGGGTAAGIGIDVGGTARFGGSLAVQSLNVRSGDVDVASGAVIGGAGTGAIVFDVDPAVASVAIGGAGGPGWSLSGAELAQFRGTGMLVATLAPVTLGALTLSGSASATPNLIGPGAAFGVSTPATIRVTGAVQLDGAGAGDRLVLSAGRVEVVTDAGGALRLAGPGGALAGRLEIDAGDLWVGSAALLGRLTADPDFDGRDAELAARPASADLAGALGADTISVFAGRSVLIANSGDRFVRAGFSVGGGGLIVRAADGGSAPVDLVVNGRAVTASGPLTNEATLAAVTLSPADNGRGYAATASVNGCVIGGACVPFIDPVQLEAEQVSVPIGPNVVGVVAQSQLAPSVDEVAAEKLPTVLVNRLIDVEPMREAPLIDEPVTSGGNSSLWSDAPGGAGEEK